jgi:hypothetical protein
MATPKIKTTPGATPKGGTSPITEKKAIIPIPPGRNSANNANGNAANSKSTNTTSTRNNSRNNSNNVSHNSSTNHSNNTSTNTSNTSYPPGHPLAKYESSLLGAEEFAAKEEKSPRFGRPLKRASIQASVNYSVFKPDVPDVRVGQGNGLGEYGMSGDIGKWQLREECSVGKLTNSAALALGTTAVRRRIEHEGTLISLIWNSN